MNSHIFRALSLTALALTAAGAATLTLDSSALYGPPGATVGWGFTIQSTPIDDNGATITPWLIVTFADFVPDPGVYPVGIFTPYITLFPNNTTVIGPDTGNGELNPWSQTFDQALMTGIGEYDINSFQLPGDQVTGSIVLDYDEFRVSPNDPSFNPDTDTIATGQTLAAAASVKVTPEPGTLSLLALAAIAALSMRSRRRARALY